MEAKIITLLEELGDGLSRKKLKKLALEEGDKKEFKAALSSLVASGRVVEDEGNETYSLGAVEEKKEKKEKSKKKRERAEEEEEEEGKGEEQAIKSKKKKSAVAVEKEEEEEEEEKEVQQGESEDVGTGSVKNLWKNGEQAWRDGTLDAEYLSRNPDKITRLFCGNLSLSVTEEALKEFLPGIVFIKWQKDKVTKEFYGSTFLEMKDPRAAALAVMQDKVKFMGRPLKIYYCPPRPGDVWPPKGNSYNDGPGNQSNGSGGTQQRRSKTPRPPGCKKLYAGNLSYSIDDETIVDFFKDCGQMVGLRWLTHRDSGEFRGCGFVEFSAPEEAEKAFLLDGKELLGRPIKLDWTL